MAKPALNATAVSQVSDAALIAEVNERLRSGVIDPDALELPASDDDDDTEAAGGMATSEDEVDWHCLEEAQVRFARRDYPETLWQLEKALGRDWAGLSDLVLGRRE